MLKNHSSTQMPSGQPQKQRRESNFVGWLRLRGNSSQQKGKGQDWATGYKNEFKVPGHFRFGVETLVVWGVGRFHMELLWLGRLCWHPQHLQPYLAPFPCVGDWVTKGSVAKPRFHPGQWPWTSFVGHLMSAGTPSKNHGKRAHLKLLKLWPLKQSQTGVASHNPFMPPKSDTSYTPKGCSSRSPGGL